MSFEAPRFPAPVRAVLAAWRVAQRAGIGRASLEEDSLIRAARRSTGLHDFVDESFRDPMQRMLTSLEEEADLHPLGRVIMRESLVRALVNRLRLEDLCDRHPEIAALPVEAPVFVVGLQRTLVYLAVVLQLFTLRAVGRVPKRNILVTGQTVAVLH